jgi:NAD-dependent dihydropyrimidine dehydrogenase PreA subunit
MQYLKNVVSLKFFPERCAGCGVCLDVCPHEVFEPVDGRVRVRDKDSCMECGACALNCPTGAISVQAGVGCAAAVISAALGRQGSACCCVVEKK